MNIQQALYQQKKPKENTKLQIASKANPTNQLNELVDKLLARIRTQGSLQHFAFVVQNNTNLQEELTKITDKSTFVDKLLELARNQGGYKFTAQEVMTIPGSWSANSVEELISAFYKLAQGSFEQFLTDVKTNLALQQKLNEKLKVATNKGNVAETLAKLGEEEGYSFTDKDVEEIAQEILSTDRVGSDSGPLPTKGNTPPNKRTIGRI